uniref:Toll-like receptor 9 n=1 Tax=Erpetoichthys calabaricus TaxID=27687 RepID=A0A8C4XIN1_ERPCA
VRNFTTFHAPLKDLLVLLVFFLSKSSLVICSFPAFLPCGNLSRETIDCCDHGLSEIPNFQISTWEVSTLLLNLNYISHISNSSFSMFPHLRYLNLDYNCPYMKNAKGMDCHILLETGAFLGLIYLQALSLRGNGLTSIPPLPPSLKNLTIDYNHLLFLKPPSISGLHVLYADGNCYYRNPCNSGITISENFFQSMTEIRILSLKYNNLTAVPKNLPSSLQILYLQANQIHTIGPGDFSALIQLSTLDMRENCRRCDHASNPCLPCQKGSMHLHRKSFSDLHALTWLHLSDNSLTSLDEQLIFPLKNLEFLDLSVNFLSKEKNSALVLGEKAFKHLVRLKTLSMSFNYKQKTSFKKLILSQDFSFLEALEELHIAGCFFHSVEPESIKPLAALSKLVRIDLRLNLIRNLKLQIFANKTSLTYIGLSENEITCSSCQHDDDEESQETSPSQNLPSHPNPDPDSFLLPSQQCKHYSTLNLRKNNLIFIRPHLFQGFEHIECLLLSHNSISQAFNGTQFVNLRNLKILDVSYNRINLYADQAFRELEHLEVLDLSYNSYHFMMSGMGHRLNFIEKLPHLRRLNLGNNGISSRITKEIRSTSLQEFIFQGNHLDIMWARKLYSRFFKNLSNLTMLDLSQNYLTEIPQEVMKNLPSSLRKLYLHSNRLAYFPWKMLSFLPNLELLDLSRNRFVSLSPKAVINSYLPCHSHLDTVVLSMNRLDEIESNFFNNATVLSHLNLSFNLLQKIDFTNDLLQRLQVIDIQGNPLICSCDSTIFQVFANFNISIPDLTNRVKCGSPVQLKGQSIFVRDALLCTNNLNMFLFVSTFLINFLLTAIIVLKQLLSWDVWYIFHMWSAKCYGLLFTTPQKKAYDAFVAFDKQQEFVSDWVYNELRVQLEENGIHRFRLCLEERDWLPGMSSIENLYNSVVNSKVTLFVLTKENCMSGVLREAFFIAQQRLLDEKKDVMIFILLEKAWRTSRYLQLRRHLCSETILLWPASLYKQHYFWYRLRCIMGKDLQSYYDRKFIALCTAPTS